MVQQFHYALLSFEVIHYNSPSRVALNELRQIVASNSKCPWITWCIQNCYEHPQDLVHHTTQDISPNTRKKMCCSDWRCTLKKNCINSIEADSKFITWWFDFNLKAFSVEINAILKLWFKIYHLLKFESFLTCMPVLRLEDISFSWTPIGVLQVNIQQ